MTDVITQTKPAFHTNSLHSIYLLILPLSMFWSRGLALIITVVLYNPLVKVGYYDLNSCNLISFPPLSCQLLYNLANLTVRILSAVKLSVRFLSLTEKFN